MNSGPSDAQAFAINAFKQKALRVSPMQNILKIVIFEDRQGSGIPLLFF